MPGESSRRAVLLDAMGTLLTFEPPAPHLRAALLERLGVDVGEEAAARAIAAEIAYYRAHLHEGRDEAGLAALRRASAEAMRPALPGGAAEAGGELLTAALLDSLRFVAYPEVPDALAALRAAGWRLVVVSNWDVSLHERLFETGLAALVDGAVASAELGAAKPDGAIFAHALALAGAAPEDAWHVGDSVAADVEGARAAGVRPVLVARDGEPGVAGVPSVRTLAELPPLLRAASTIPARPDTAVDTSPDRHPRARR
jgi:putative hydrolase of the HAD superfamily